MKLKPLSKISALASTFYAASLIVYANPIFAQTITTVNTGTGYASDIGTVINAVLRFVMVIAALLVFLYLIWGGIEWITSGGDKGKTESARNKITAAVIGLIVLAASYAILLLVLNFLGFSDGIDGAFRQSLDYGITGN